MELYPPQEEAIRAGVLEGKNLVLAVPTASGKTLVAELCAIKHVLERRGKVLYLVPLKALAAEKYEEFKALEELGIRVTLSTGDFDTVDPSLVRYDIIVATNEKADSIIRHRPSWINRISLVVADEAHLLGEPSRGPTLEALLTVLKTVNPHAQFLALSATIKNAAEIAEWLGAILVTSNWRPVTLKEGVYFNNSIFFKDGSVLKINGPEKDPVAILTIDVIRSGGQMIIFTGSRLSAVSLTKRLLEPVRRLLKSKEERRLLELSSKILQMGERTRISDMLSRAVAHGVAFHHAGLTYGQRRAIEDAFRSFLIKCICATPTLAAGVDMPARRVLIYEYRRYEPGLGQTNIPVLEEKQMAGRAGRPKYDKVGEAILLARSESERDFLLEEYVLAEPEMIWSKLGVASSLRSHILATITTGLVYSEEDLYDFFGRTLFAHQYGLHTFRSKVADSLHMLSREGLVISSKSHLTPTKFGMRVAELYIDPASAVIIRDALKLRRSGMPPISYLTLICHTPDMPKLYIRKREIEPLATFLDSNSDLFLFDLPEEDDPSYESLLEEIKTALLLKEWIEESPEDSIIERFDVGSGDIYAFVESAKWLIHSAHELAKLFAFTEAVRPLMDLYLRIENGVREELLPLISLRGIGRVRARALYSAGFRTIEDLHLASPSDLMKIPQIGPETARLIKEQVGGKVSKEEWSLMKSKKVSKQLSIDEY
ncbi:MAG: DEAD/DEAH box helicase [Candidatus Methanomethylicaceae archaeon]